MRRIPGDPQEIADRLSYYSGKVPSSWDPGGAHADAMSIRWGSSGEGVIDDDLWVSSTFRALQKWTAFRNATVPLDRFRRALAGAQPHISGLEAVTIIDYDPAVHERALFELFGSVAEVKPTLTKWMVTSKILYHLLPDLVVPLDNKFTAPFFGSSNLPRGLDLHFLRRTYDAFSTIAEVGHDQLVSLASGFSPRLGLARVVDRGIVGFEMTRSERGEVSPPPDVPKGG